MRSTGKVLMKNKDLKYFLWKASKQKLSPQFINWYIKIPGPDYHNILKIMIKVSVFNKLQSIYQKSKVHPAKSNQYLLIAANNTYCRYKPFAKSDRSDENNYFNHSG